MSDDLGPLLFIFLITYAVYMFPHIVHGFRKESGGVAFWFLNLFLNWLVIPWFIFLYMACTGKNKKELKAENELRELQLAEARRINTSRRGR